MKKYFVKGFTLVLFLFSFSVFANVTCPTKAQILDHNTFIKVESQWIVWFLLSEIFIHDKKSWQYNLVFKDEKIHSESEAVEAGKQLLQKLDFYDPPYQAEADGRIHCLYVQNTNQALMAVTV